MTDFEPDDPVTREKTYRAIGHFMFQFSQTEFTIRGYLAHAIGLSDVHFDAVTSAFDVAGLCKITQRVFVDRPGAARIKEGLDRFSKINEHRVRVAHGLWMPSINGGAVEHVSRNSRKANLSVGQAEELERLALELAMVRAELDSAFDASMSHVFNQV
jgi:hypothetical protein